MTPSIDKESFLRPKKFNFASYPHHSYRWLSLGWGIFIALAALNCYVYGLLVSGESHTYQQSLVWAVQHWWKWIVFSPFALKESNRCSSVFLFEALFKHVLPKATLLSLAAIVLSTWYDAVDKSLNMPAIVHVLSKQFFSDLYVGMGLYSCILIVGYLVTRRNREQKEQLATQTLKPKIYLKRLVVSKGLDKVLIEVSDIRYVTAAGNYLEVHTEKGEYLLRKTMKSLESTLDPTQFLRIHRSAMVAIRCVNTISSRASGDYLLTLHCGAQLIVSKSYRNILKQVSQAKLVA